MGTESGTRRSSNHGESERQEQRQEEGDEQDRVVTKISVETELSRKEVNKVLEALGNQVERSLSKRGPCVFTLPGLVKIERRKVPAKKARGEFRTPSSRAS